MPRLKGRKEITMEINKIDLMQALYGTYETAFQSSSSSISDDGSWAVGNRPSERMDISMVGKFKNVVSQLSDDEKEEIRTFYEEMMKAVKNGTFDASEMAANAPEALKSFAEENGIDLETMLEDQASAPPPPPPPPPPNDTSGGNGYGMTNSTEEGLNTAILKYLFQGEEDEESIFSVLTES
jgi:hypothetical protein